MRGLGGGRASRGATFITTCCFLNASGVSDVVTAFMFVKSAEILAALTKQH